MEGEIIFLSHLPVMSVQGGFASAQDWRSSDKVKNVGPISVCDPLNRFAF